VLHEQRLLNSPTSAALSLESVLDRLRCDLVRTTIRRLASGRRTDASTRADCGSSAPSPSRDNLRELIADFVVRSINDTPNARASHRSRLLVSNRKGDR
jgi:hypothetical protein